MKNGAKFENNKGRIARITVMILAIAIMTTSLAVGTFAKYATGNNTSDTARVAKWGVTIEITGSDDMFVNSYDNDVNPTVLASDRQDVVAPGTKNTTGVVFTIDGTPEVKTKVDVKLTDSNGQAAKDIYLEYGFEDDPDTADVDESESNFYYPVVFTLTQIGNRNGDLATPVVLETGTLADISEFLDEYSASAYYEPNTDLGASFRLTWEWVYERGNGAEITANDVLDTALGDIAAGLNVSKVNGKDVLNSNLTLDYKVSITVVQVD